MRPALQALASQQQVLQKQAQVITAQGHTIEQLKRVAAQQREQLVALGRGLQAIATMAGVEPQVRTAMLKRADEQNPTQPVPEPPAQPAPFSTVQTETPEAMDNVLAPGSTPGSTKDVAADTVSTVYTPGDDIPAPPVKNLVDVTAPVDGTQGPRPLNEVRTETDVRHGNPMAPSPAFPLRGDFANAPRMGSKQGGAPEGSAANPVREGDSNRTMACLRLARLQIEAGIAEGDDFALATSLETSAASNEAISHEIATLDRVRTASKRTTAAPKGLVPRAATAGVQRTVPSMQGVSHTASSAAVDDELADADLFT